MENCKHDYRNDTMNENGVKYPIKVCNKCGDWR